MRLRTLEGAWRLDHLPGHDAPPPPDDVGWLALVRAPEGLTVIRRASDATPAAERWSALYDEDAGHGLDVPGLLAAVIGPLADAGIPVFVASTFHADLVLVPQERLDAARAALEGAGHELAHPPAPAGD